MPPRSSPQPTPAAGHSELKAALRACRTAFIGVATTSGFINVLTLSASFYMLEVYDRVLPSKSIPTLVGLSILVGGLYVFQAILDLLRGRILIRIGAFLDETLSSRVYEALVRLPLRARLTGDGIQPLRDLDQVRSYSSGPGPTALFDLPWMPLYLGICFLFHPLIGLAATIGGLVLIVLTLLTESLTLAPMKTASRLGAERSALAEASRRNAEVLQAMGMTTRLAVLWQDVNVEYMASQRRASDVGGAIGSFSRIFRLALQSGILGLGAYLVVHQEATGGIIIASSILTSRALAPVELAIANWKGFVATRQSWRRLSELLRLFAQPTEVLALAPARQSLAVAGVTVAPPGGRAPVVVDATFSLTRGDALGVIGPSASGKSSLARAIVGVWPLLRGSVRLDGAALDQWHGDELGKNIGFLPQDVELFAGSVAENIARFERNPSAEKVVAAARVAGVHDMILRLPQGYETDIGDSGMALSAGQRQRVALARALYGDPFLVVLDEPNSNLDAEGDHALTQAILHTRSRGGIVIVIAHRPTAIAGTNLVLVMTDSRIQDFGPKDEVMNKLLGRPTSLQTSPAPLRVVPER